MPFILFCGIPSSGKTTRAKELATYIEGMGHKVVVVNEESLKVDRNKTYQGNFEDIYYYYCYCYSSSSSYSLGISIIS